MSVKDYAKDLNLSVAEVLKKCMELNIKASSGDESVYSFHIPWFTCGLSNEWQGYDYAKGTYCRAGRSARGIR